MVSRVDKTKEARRSPPARRDILGPLMANRQSLSLRVCSSSTRVEYRDLSTFFKEGLDEWPLRIESRSGSVSTPRVHCLSKRAPRLLVDEEIFPNIKLSRFVYLNFVTRNFILLPPVLSHSFHHTDIVNNKLIYLVSILPMYSSGYRDCITLKISTVL